MNQPVSKAESIAKAYKRTYYIAMIIYAVVLLASVFLTKHGPPSAWWRIPLALVPLIPVFFALRAFLRFFSRLDELQRRIQLEALALSFGVTCVVTWSYGLLEYVGFPDVSLIWVPPFMLLFWSISVHIASQRYQ
jgi:ABC-type multidrug transport system permease subunit